MERKLPIPVLHLLMVWYQEQHMRVKWNLTLSDPFFRQGGVFSPILFNIYIYIYIYIDYLLVQLKELRVGCHGNHHFAGVVRYTDDLTLLAPSPALRVMLQMCEQFADSHGLKFNAN